ncbi:MAG: ATP-binding protein [Velocimicrobium sp.]
MFSYSELMELDELCKEDSRFEKYVERLREENNQLLSKVTHEIGNPLTIIYSTIQLMESKNACLVDEPYWLQLTKDVKDLSLLLHNYSDYNSCATLNLKKENLLEVLQTVSESFEPVFIHNNLDWSFHVSRSMIPLMSSYLCDIVKIRQVFVNILKNGVEALESKQSLWIQIPDLGEQIEDMTQGHNFIILHFGNNGLPIETNKIAGMFLPRASNKVGGSGIGLWISNRIVEAHGGKIFVNSDKDKTIFTVCLPL